MYVYQILKLVKMTVITYDLRISIFYINHQWENDKIEK